MTQSQIFDAHCRDNYLSGRDDLESGSSELGPPLSELKCLGIHNPKTRVFRQLPEVEYLCIHSPGTQGGKEEVNSTVNCSQNDAPLHTISKIDDQNFGAAAPYRSYSKGGEVTIGDKCLNTSCRRRKNRNRSLEMALEATLLLSSVHAAGARALVQMVQIRERNPNSKRSLEALITLFGASFLCTFLGALMLLVIVSRREYYQYKKLCLVISNAAAFVLMMIGYCFVVAFNM